MGTLEKDKNLHQENSTNQDLSLLMRLSVFLFACILVLFSVASLGFEGEGYSRRTLASGGAFYQHPEYDALNNLPPPPEVLAHAFIVKIVGENKILLKQREWKALPPASLTKILTAALASEYISEDEKLTLTKEDIVVGEKVSLIPAGEIFSRDDMLRLALISSANDAAMALAETVGRKLGAKDFSEAIANFVALMNKKSQILGLANSHFENPTGLDEDHHYASAEDLAKISEYVWFNHQELLRIMREREATIFSNEGREYDILSTNELLDEFPGIYGGKTGLTDKAKGTLILFYPVGKNKTAVMVILGSEQRFEDGRNIIKWLENLF